SSSSSALCLSERARQVAVAQPEVIQQFISPITYEISNKIINDRLSLSNLLKKDNPITNPLVIISGPNFIGNKNQAKACSNWLNKFQKEKSFNLNLFLLMRCNLMNYNYSYEEYDDNEKIIPYGNKSSINDSCMSYEVNYGVPYCRNLLLEIVSRVPIVGELADTITPQYTSDLYSMAIIGSSVVESQLHRELVSGASYAVGFQTSDYNNKNVNDLEKFNCKITSSTQAILASNKPHHFLSITKTGQAAIVCTTGNDETFVILQLNNIYLELSNQDIKDTIAKILRELKLKERNKVKPVILFDVGLINLNNIFKYYEILKTFLVDEAKTSAYVLGVQINSGDDY
ncbi:aldolase, partial [Ascoidea rubescens DSM 1968]